MQRRTSPFILVSLALLSLIGCTREIPPASVGVKFNANTGISETLLKPQVVWVGYYDRIIIYPTSIRNASYVRNANEGERMGDDSIPASTSEGAILPLDVTVSYHVAPEDVTKAFENFGTEDLNSIQRKFIRWTTVYGINLISGKKSIFDLTSKDRQALGQEAKKIIAPLMAQSGITVDDVFIGEVYPPEEIKKKVEDRIAVRNELELAKVGLEKSRIDAQTTLTNAKKNAELNRLLAQQGEKTLELKRLELQRQAIERWDGRPPVIGDGKIPFTNIEVK